MNADPTQRFSSRVESYVRFRPGYPSEILAALEGECGFKPESRVADIGSGTGILTELFLRNGNPVAAVEPNREMREAAERRLGRYPNFRSVDGRAEATTLDSRSTDFVTAAQSFHWFDRVEARSEFLRILPNDGWVVLIWNERDTSSTPFARAYEELLHHYGTDYERVDHRRIDQLVLSGFFGTRGFASRSFPNCQILDHEGLRGRLFSSSYTPEPGHPNYEPMLRAVDVLFREYAVEDRVVLEYETRMYFGRLT